MDRSNYNRSSNGGGYNRGGRNKGGRDGAHDQQAYRSSASTNLNADRVPDRFGGRGRGYGGHVGGQQAYRSSEYKGQHGDRVPDRFGGRGRRYGGHVGGQLAYRSSDYTGQNGDRVPDRFGGDRELEVRTWTSAASGQPVQPHVDVCRHEVEEVPNPEVRSVSSPRGDDMGNAYVPIRRPDRGTLAMNTVKLLVNHFPVKFDPSKSIFRYDVDVKQEVEGKQEGASSSRSVRRSISKSDLRLILKELCSKYPDQIPLLRTVYDGEKYIFSAVSLSAGTYNVKLFGRSYTCTIKYGSELKLSKLQDFLNGNAAEVPRDVLQALDVVMKANLFSENVSVGRGMYPRTYREEDDLGTGVAAFRGSLQSLKVTSSGLVMCTDYSVLPFRKRILVLNFLQECVWETQDVNNIWNCKKKVMLALEGLRVSVIHRSTNAKYIVSGLSEKATRDISFEVEDPEGKKKPEVVKLTDYFLEKWGKDIVYKGIPCLKLGNSKNPNYVPMEFCILDDDRRFPMEQLVRDAGKKLRELSLLAPDNRRREICGMVAGEYASGHNGAEVIKNFDLEVDMNMKEVIGRVMAPPKLKLRRSSGKTNIVTVDKVKCHYNLHGKTFLAGKAVERWALIDFSYADRRNKLLIDPFIKRLTNWCKSLGVHMEEPLFVHRTDTKPFGHVNELLGLFEWVVQECREKNMKRLQMIFCVLPQADNGFKFVKYVSETKIGVMTQCCLSQNANKGSDQFFANLSLEINAKLGGTNVELLEQLPHFSKNDHFMFIGADVNHPAAHNTLSPSIAAVVGSMNWPAATHYVARVYPQSHRKEEIVNFGNLCLDLINCYAKVNGVKPNKIVVFRDGVGDGQFGMVLNKEMVDMKKAIYTEHYRPFITFVVAIKRHTTRLFLNDRKGSGNVPPGTVVDTKVVHPFEFGFYLCSHFGGMGTSKPTHYSVIWDENGFTSDEMQKLVYHLCYIFPCCTKPLSLVTPVYYADLAAYRGRMYQEVVMGMQPSSSEDPSFSPDIYNVEEHLKDSMFFI